MSKTSELKLLPVLKNLDNRRVPSWGRTIVGFFLWGPIVLGIVAYLMPQMGVGAFSPYVWALTVIWVSFVFRWAAPPGYVCDRASHVLADWIECYPDYAQKLRPAIEAFALQDPSVPWLWIVDLEIAARLDIQAHRAKVLSHLAKHPTDND